MAAAPACGAMLADYGAIVTKIEEPHGDIWRGNTPFKRDGKWGAFFDQENRGKRSVVLDLKAEGGVETLKMLLKVILFNVLSCIFRCFFCVFLTTKGCKWEGRGRAHHKRPQPAAGEVRSICSPEMEHFCPVSAP